MPARKASEAVKSVARYEYSKGGTKSDNPYKPGSDAFKVFNYEILECQIEELRNENRGNY